MLLLLLHAVDAVNLYDVVKYYVLPQTKKKKCSYVELVAPPPAAPLVELLAPPPAAPPLLAAPPATAEAARPVRKALLVRADELCARVDRLSLMQQGEG